MASFTVRQGYAGSAFSSGGVSRLVGLMTGLGGTGGKGGLCEGLPWKSPYTPRQIPITPD